MKPYRMSNFKFWIICIIVMAFAMALGFWVKPAEANFLCEPWSPRETLVKILTDKHGQSPVGVAKYKHPHKGFIEVWLNSSSQTWILVTSSPIGGKWKSCIITSGEGWITLETVEPLGPST